MPRALLRILDARATRTCPLRNIEPLLQCAVSSTHFDILARRAFALHARKCARDRQAVGALALLNGGNEKLHRID